MTDWTTSDNKHKYADEQHPDTGLCAPNCAALAALTGATAEATERTTFSISKSASPTPTADITVPMTATARYYPMILNPYFNPSVMSTSLTCRSDGGFLIGVSPE
jgi:hypothetical protein